MLSFTGSTATGRIVQEFGAKSNLKRVVLELGGKSPAVVFDDANLENAVTWTARAITSNAGQVCYAASSVYVQEGIYDKFLAAYKIAFDTHTKMIGDPCEPGAAIGPLVDRKQFERVQGFTERAEADGQGTVVWAERRLVRRYVNYISLLGASSWLDSWSISLYDLLDQHLSMSAFQMFKLTLVDVLNGSF
jgi:aldehyde dehydrogenase (NAD+)